MLFYPVTYLIVLPDYWITEFYYPNWLSGVPIPPKTSSLGIVPSPLHRTAAFPPPPIALQRRIRNAFAVRGVRPLFSCLFFFVVRLLVVCCPCHLQRKSRSRFIPNIHTTPEFGVRGCVGLTFLFFAPSAYAVVSICFRSCLSVYGSSL